MNAQYVRFALMLLLIASSWTVIYAQPFTQRINDNAADKTSQLNQYIDRIQEYTLVNKFDSCEAYVQKGVALIKTMKDKHRLPGFYIACGNYYKRKIRPKQSSIQFNRARYWALKTNQPELAGLADYRLACIITDKAFVNRTRTDFSTALRKIYRNIRFANKHQLKTVLASNYDLLAHFYSSYKDYQSKLIYLEKVINLNPHESDKAYLAYIKFQVNLIKKRPQEAWTNYQEIARFRNKGTINDYFTSVGVVGNYVEFGYYPEAIAVGNSLLKDHKLMVRLQVYEKIALYAHLTTAYIHQQKYRAAKDAYQKSLPANYHLALSAFNGFPDFRVIMFQNQQALLEHDRKFRQALKLAYRLKAINDSSNSDRRVFELAASQQQFENEVVEDSLTGQIKLQTLANRFKQKSLEQARKIQWLSGAIIAFLILVVGIIFSQIRKIKKQAGELNTLNAQKDKLFAIISHDLRSPVAVLHSYLGLVDPGQYPLKTAHTLSSLKLQVGLVSNTLDNLLNWSISQLGGIRPRIGPVQLIDPVEHVLELLHPYIYHKSIQVRLDLAESRVFADENLTEVVLRNILHNAIKFTPENGTIQIRATKSRGEIVLTIQDSGVGMTSIQLKQVFVNYSSQPGLEGEKGTGLGLKLSQDLMMLQGGRLELVSSQQTGTGVHLFFGSALWKQSAKYKELEQVSSTL